VQRLQFFVSESRPGTRGSHSARSPRTASTGDQDGFRGELFGAAADISHLVTTDAQDEVLAAFEAEGVQLTLV
jgi:hypothetical protein